MENFEQRKAEYLTKIKNNPDIISKFVIDKNTEKGKKTIERIFDKGIRFWQPHATFGNFDPVVNPNAPIEGSEGNG